MKIAVLGAGFTGLTCAFRLAKKGDKVTVFEKGKIPGGLASGFKLKNWEWSLEQHYHHLFTSDKFTINLLKEIGMEDLLIYARPETSIYYNSPRESRLLRSLSIDDSLAMTGNNIYPFDSPFDLLTFPHLSFLDRLRTGIVIAYLKFSPFWQSLEKVTASIWLKKYMGGNSYRILWEPLLVGKFGKEAKNISMAWFWARIHKRSPSLGYIKGGFQNFAARLAEEIKNRDGKILLETTVLNCHCDPDGIATLTSIARNDNKITVSYLYNAKEHQDQFDKVICTLPTKVYLYLAKDLPNDYIKKLNSICHLDALNYILILNKPFFSNKTYWLNINQKEFPFLALVEHTNFMDRKYYGGNYIVYIGNYLRADHPYFEKTKEELLEIFTPYLEKFNKDFRKNIVDLRLFHGTNAQTIVPVSYSLLKPDFITPWKNLYLANLDMVYPWDRGVNYAIELGEKAAKLVQS